MKLNTVPVGHRLNLVTCFELTASDSDGAASSLVLSCSTFSGGSQAPAHREDTQGAQRENTETCQLRALTCWSVGRLRSRSPGPVNILTLSNLVKDPDPQPPT